MSVFDVYDPLKNITPRFTEEQLEDMMKWFDETAKPLLTINDGEPINVITIENLMEYLNLKKFHRRHFHYPSYGELMSAAEELNAGFLRILTKEQFIYVLNKWVQEPILRHELLLAFKVFDTEKRNFLELDELEAIVKNYADSFTDSEIRELLRDANVRGDGYIFYEDFIEALFSLAPELYDLKTDYLYEDPDEDPSVPPEPEPEPEPEVPPPPPPPPPPPASGKKNKKKK